ncbi:hypothetical protein ACOSQ2_027295 [Xanthoceras sorbifolium]
MVGVDGHIKLEVGQLFRSFGHFRQVFLDYSIQEGFRHKRLKNEFRRITCVYAADDCQWRVHGSPTYDRVSYMLKTLKDEHNCLSVDTNKDVTSNWIGEKFKKLIKENPYMNINVLGSIVLRNFGVTVPDHTLYRAKTYTLNIGNEDHKKSYDKLYKYGHIFREKNPGSSCYLDTIRYNSNPNIPAHFQRFFLSFYAQKMGYLEGCRPFIGLDGCHLKGQLEGILLCAIAIDVNCGVYPVALDVCEIECCES